MELPFHMVQGYIINKHENLPVISKWKTKLKSISFFKSMDSHSQTSPWGAPAPKSSTSPVEAPGPVVQLCPVPLVLSHWLRDTGHLSPSCLLSPGICVVSLPKNIQEIKKWATIELAAYSNMLRLQNNQNKPQRNGICYFTNGNLWPRVLPLPPRRATPSIPARFMAALLPTCAGIFSARGRSFHIQAVSWIHQEIDSS